MVNKKIFLVIGLSVSFLSGCDSNISNLWAKLQDKTEDSTNESNSNTNTDTTPGDNVNDLAPTYLGMSIKVGDINNGSRANLRNGETNSYTLNKNEEFFFEIHFENPNKYEIQSFTLNDVKYVSYMFERTSTLETLYIKSTSPNSIGTFSYTIDKIKYFDDESIKDVKIGGNQTINVEILPYKVDLFTNDSSYGTVSGAGYYEEGEQVTVTATTTEDGYFCGWYYDDNFSQLASKSNVFTFTMPGNNICLYANFTNKLVSLWTCYGGAYISLLNGLFENIESETHIQIEHTPQVSLDEINRNMISAIAVGDYPNIAMGSKDHFYTYLSSAILEPIDNYLTDSSLSDYYEQYMYENYFYDDGGENAQKRLYGLPFSNATELLGYNGVFVDYCATINPELANIPATWQEWEVKAPLYNTIFKSLMGKILYGKQDVEGKASDFSFTEAAGLSPLLDMSKVDPLTSALMSWDATDNAFITLTRQWGAQYTNLPDSEKTKIPKKRVGEVLFNSSEYQPKVIEMLKFFNKFNKQRIFDTPIALGGSYASSAFEQCKVMFMVCSSGGLSYNTAIWNHRFRVAPLPYYDDGYDVNKYVMSQNINICLTNKDNYEDSVSVIKSLTSGKFQTEWCLNTGYFPTSNSSAQSQEYQAFLNETSLLPQEEAYQYPTKVAYREGSVLNACEYMDSTKGWTKYADATFRGSSDIRSVVKGVFSSVFNLDADAADSAYKAKLDDIEESPILKGQSTIRFIH